MANNKKIPAKTTLRLLDSVAFMNYQDGVAFNGMITVNFEQLGINNEQGAAQALTKLNEAVADRIRRYGERWGYQLPHFFLYVHEDVQSSHGHHVHELVVVPPGLGLDLNGWLKGWARRNYGANVDDAAIDYRGQYPTERQERAKQQANLVKYIFKSSADRCIRSAGGEPTTLHTILEVHKRQRAYCADVKRVAGCSQNISMLPQLQCGFWGAQYAEQVFTDYCLGDFERACRSAELTEMLRKLDI